MNKYEEAYREHINGLCLSELIEVCASLEKKTIEQCLKDIILDLDPTGKDDGGWEERRSRL